MQGPAFKPNERDILALVAQLMPEIALRERKQLVAELDGGADKHISEQFPAEIGGSEQKMDHSVSTMIHQFSVARPGVLKPSARPANRLMNALLQFALTKAGHKDNLFALTAERPNFARLAMKAGVSEESAGGDDSKLMLKKEGGELEPRSIGMVGKVWQDYLRYAQAMMNVRMPDGTVYGLEAGFIVLEECFAAYASQRPNVPAVCGALTAGWEKLCDELVTSSDSFVNICRSMKKEGVWVESETLKRKNSDKQGGDVKKLRAEIKALRQQRAGKTSMIRTFPGSITGW